MKQAIISDIHGNQEALIAVLEDIEDRGIDDIICLGDIAGYGPEPAECVALVQERCRLSLMGNHDHAVLHGPDGFNIVAAQAIECHKRMLEKGCLDNQRCSAHIGFLEDQPLKLEENGALFVHASPRDPVREYVLRSDVEYGPTDKIKSIFDMIEGVCFVGHSHQPGVINADFEWLTPAEANGLDVTKGKFLVNEGSVGQPRDGDPRACYVEWTDGCINYHRVKYPVQTTMEKIEKSGCLHSYCATRLAAGK